ncbi:MAG: PxKF domain-containing protein, partial [Mycobacteriales bacterium]
ITEDTKSTTVNGSCTNGAGQTTNAAPLTVKLDTTAPTAALAATGTAGDNGWFIGNVTVTTTGSDPISGPVTCTASQAQTGETTGQAFTGSCTNGAGLTTAATALTVKLDKSAPSASLAVTNGTTGSNGWYVSDVTVSTTGADTISNPVSCTAAQTLSGDTKGDIVNGSCTNAAGLVGTAAPLTIKLDKTPPVVTVINLDPSYVVGSVPNVTCSTTDPTSGVATSATPSVPVLSGVGVYTVTCSGASDNAGNAGSASATLRSIYGWNGFLQPINDTAHQIGTATSIFKAGSTVPVKFELRRADGTIITPTSAPVWLTPVRGSRTTAAVDEPVYTELSTAGGFYRASGSQWIYNWSTKGLAAGYYYRIGVTLDDGQTYYVNIGLR